MGIGGFAETKGSKSPGLARGGRRGRNPAHTLGVSAERVYEKSGGGASFRRLYFQTLGNWFGDVRRLGSFRALHDLKLYRISFLERPVAIADDRGIMYEDIGPIITPYESVTFGIIEPLNCSLHFVSPLAGDQHFYSWGGSETNRRHEHELRGVYQNGIIFCYGKNVGVCIFIQKNDLNGRKGTLF
jgi:hypothetical protein